MEPVRRILDKANTRQIVDLCSGSGGLLVELQASEPVKDDPVHVTFTDKYPNRPALERLCAANPHASFVQDSVSATHVPKTLDGVRTLFVSFHHFLTGRRERNSERCL